MKQRKTKQPTFMLTGAIQLATEEGLFQYYQGDFFTIFVMAPLKSSLLQRLKEKYLGSRHSANLHYDDANFLFELYLQPEAIEDYQDMAGVTNLETLIPFWSIAMEHAVKAFFNTPLKGPLADRFIYARVIDLLVQFVHHIHQVHEITIDNNAIQHAEKAKQLIIDDLSEYDTVEAVARKVGITEAELQCAFKYRFGMTVGRFSKDERMKYAHYLLETTDDILLSIALAVGYNDPGNFSVAFKNYFGYSPGYIQRKKKLLDPQQHRSNSE